MQESDEKVYIRKQKKKKIRTTERLVTNEVEREHKKKVGEFRFKEGTKTVKNKSRKSITK
jgi:hypothetical protein